MNWFVSAVCRIGSSLPYLTQQLVIELEIRHIGKTLTFPKTWLDTI
jgi:hypothetical protein